MSESPFKSRLYLVVEAGPAAADRLSAALAVGEVACVLIVPSAGAELDAGTAQPLVALAQRAGAAALLADDGQLARSLKADGVHLSPGQDYGEARELLGARYIVGADAGGSRDAAMTLAEQGVDYIAFGGDSEDDRAWRDGLVEWWAEIFQVPCVALDVTQADEARALQAAGCEFIAIPLLAGETPDASRARVAEIAAALVTSGAEAEA